MILLLIVKLQKICAKQWQHRTISLESGLWLTKTIRKHFLTYLWNVKHNVLQIISTVFFSNEKWIMLLKNKELNRNFRFMVKVDILMVIVRMINAFWWHSNVENQNKKNLFTLSFSFCHISLRLSRLIWLITTFLVLFLLPIIKQ